ncbi:MAG: hypothetical protein M0Z50_19120 [Planctomycetia bacterium]|nr:hypothetical protein [Planctomycetia bacterium]
MEYLTEMELSEYLDEKYPNEAMEGHRQQLYAAAYDIAQLIVNFHDVTDPRDGMIMRRAWECSRAGQSNFACSALGDALGGFDRAYWEHVGHMISLPGFLTRKEKWHSARLKGKGVTVYRGCSDAEIDAQELGYSWTLDKEVAGFFASIHGGKILTATFGARMGDGAWLDTAESEIIWTAQWDDDVVTAIEDAPAQAVGMNWDKRKHLTPSRAKAAA